MGGTKGMTEISFMEMRPGFPTLNPKSFNAVKVVGSREAILQIEALLGL